MTKDDFINEVKNSSMAVQDFDKMYENFSKYQQKAVETLLVFHQICENYGIDYQLAFGSLLGAIRDNGIIPWDYDVDVFVPFWQKERLIQVLRKYLPKEYYFVGIETNPKCPRDLTRLTPVGYDSDILHVDIFYLAYAPSDIDKQEKMRSRLHELQVIRHNKYRNLKKESHGNFNLWMHYFYQKCRALLVSGKHLIEEHDRICGMYSKEDSPYLVPTGFFASSFLYDRSMLDHTVLYETSLGVFRIPRDYKHWLKYRYGNWEEVPPLKDRLKELMHHYRLMK